MQEFQLSCPRMFVCYHQRTHAANILQVHILQVKILLNSTILIKASFLVTLGTYILCKHNLFFFPEQYASFSVCVALTIALVLYLLSSYTYNFSDLIS